MQANSNSRIYTRDVDVEAGFGMTQAVTSVGGRSLQELALSSGETCSSNGSTGGGDGSSGSTNRGFFLPPGLNFIGCLLRLVRDSSQ
eukprot:scaffold66611_cov65-Phaeocystis_antarctica.AAC.11